MDSKNYCDSEILTDNPDSEQEKDTLQDPIREKKLLHKAKEFRIQKEIWKSSDFKKKPLKFDEIKYRLLEIDNPESKKNKELNVEEINNKYFSLLSQIQEKIESLNKNENQWFDLSLLSMKKGEISYFCIEYIKRDENKKKIIEKKKHYLIELSDFTPVQDIKQDGNYLKKMIQKGVGNTNCQKQDEISFTYKLSRGEQILDQKDDDKIIKFSDIPENKYSNVIWTILNQMREQEIAQCTISQSAFENDEVEEFKQKYQISENQNNEKYILDIQVKKLTVVQNVFSDGSAIKKILKRGVSQNRPEKLCRIYFYLQISINDKIIFESGKCDRQDLKKEKDDEQIQFLENETNCWKYYLDEYKISKLLKRSLRKMRKQEEAIIQCKNSSLIQFGEDFQIISKAFDGKIPDEVTYFIKVYDFTEGKSTFTMTIVEKIEQAQRKKATGLQFIKEGNYKKALKTFDTINGFFDLGRFLGQDAIDVHPHKLSSLLNTSLCYMKLQEWENLISCCNKIIEMEPNNTKAIYRKALGFKEQQDFENALKILNNHLNLSKEQIDQNLLSEVTKLKSQIQQVQEQFLQKQRKTYSKMFS